MADSKYVVNGELINPYSIIHQYLDDRQAASEKLIAIDACLARMGIKLEDVKEVTYA